VKADKLELFLRPLSLCLGHVWPEGLLPGLRADSARRFEFFPQMACLFTVM